MSEQRRFHSLLPRRTFLAGCVACSLASLSACQQPKARSRLPISIGRLTDIPPGRSLRQTERLVLLRDDKGLGAMSLLCTHETCLLELAASGLICPCHGSRFTASGQCIQGPAVSDLPWFALSVGEDSEVMVHFDQIVDPLWRLPI